jgi:hypothetical protein
VPGEAIAPFQAAPEPDQEVPPAIATVPAEAAARSVRVTSPNERVKSDFFVAAGVAAACVAVALAGLLLYWRRRR